MASRLGSCPRAALLLPRRHNLLLAPSLEQASPFGRGRGQRSGLGLGIGIRVRVSDGGDSYLDMWKKAVDKERKALEFQRLVENSEANAIDGGGVEELERKSEEFQKILEVPKEERDRIQQLQVIDRATAAIAAARAVLDEKKLEGDSGSGKLEPSGMGDFGAGNSGGTKASREGRKSWSKLVIPSESSKNGIPGPDFWSWVPPESGDGGSYDASDLLTATQSSENPSPTNPVVEKERSIDSLLIPFESKLNKSNYPPLPPLQSLMEVQKEQVSESSIEITSLKEDHELGHESSVHAAEVARALEQAEETSPYGVNADGTRWWKETGIERRPDGVLCRWTMNRGVSTDQTIEWQEKFWEASDDFGYKELGSEKSGRDATGNVWREFWRESMWQEHGLLNIEKTADKWGKNDRGDEWQENWWERYNASGEAEKWAHKWCSVDPNTQLEAGHAHIWHERWGEKYDGHGGSTKYTDKWAERSEGDGWTKWGDKWDEHFDPNGHGVKQGETWWAGKYGERWNRTWGEHHNGSGWIHKYGKSSSGEHWDTHVEQETWYERFPHYGFYHCYDSSVQLREVPKPCDML